jgi:hypothetical protein
MAEDVKKPTHIRADAIPTDGYILTVDGKLKARYKTEQDATTEAEKLKQPFPMLQVSVYDATKEIHNAGEYEGTMTAANAPRC